MRLTLTLLLCLSHAAWCAPEPAKSPEPPAKSPEPAKESPPAKINEPVVRKASVEINGVKIPYQVTTGKLQLKQDDGKIKASIFHVSYERREVPANSARPVVFAFNGGPGSSAVWLHLGVLGPKIIRLPGNGTSAPQPPVHVMDNPQSILDVCDLVFIDPVSTGYSRAENDTKPGDFHGLNEDIESVGDFIRRWTSEHDRWASPKFLLGESYGGIRAAGLAQHLQTRYGMSLNGVILLSSLLDFATLQPAAGNDLSYLVYLPAFTGTAHFHHKITGDRDALLAESRQFAFGDYAAALLQGSSLDPVRSQQIATTLERLTGISATVWLTHHLRLDPNFFRCELLRSTGMVLGRFDSRVAWPTTEQAAVTPEYDPSYALAYGAFATAMLDYLGRDLGYKEDQPYEILTGKVNPWRWNANNEVVNLGDRLATAMRDNPQLRVLVMGGRTDLATPPDGLAYSLRHLLDLPPAARDRITTTHYDGGHMFYLNPPDLTQARADLVKFIQASQP